MAVVKRRQAPLVMGKAMTRENQENDVDGKERTEKAVKKEEIWKPREPKVELEYNGLEEFQASEAKQSSWRTTDSGILSIVKSETVNRIMFAKEMMDKLSNPKRVVISFADEKIAIGEQLPNNENYLKVNYSKTKGVIYSAGVVKEIVDKYDLDFSTRTSITFSEVKYVRYENHVVAIVTIV